MPLSELLTDLLADAEANFVASARRVNYLRGQLGVRPLGLEDLPPSGDATGEPDGERSAEDQSSGQTSTHLNTPTYTTNGGEPEEHTEHRWDLVCLVGGEHGEVTLVIKPTT